MKIIDQLDRKLLFTKTPKRIISLVPSQTELLVDLGLEDSLIGITKFCVHPKHLRQEKTIVGGTKNIHLDRISELNPDIIICNKEENTQEIVAKCEEVANVYVSNILTVEDNLQFILDMGSVFNKSAKAKNIVTIMKRKQKDFENFIADIPLKKVAYFIWKAPWMVAGNNNFINELLKLNRFENVFQNLDRYPEIDISSLQNLNLDLILLSSEPFPFKEKHIKELQEYTNAKIILVDGEYFSWYGSRLIKAFEYFKKLL